MNSKRISTYAAVVAVAFLCASTTRVNAQRGVTVDWFTSVQAISLADGTTGVPIGDYVGLGIFRNNMSNATITALWTDNPNAATDIMAQFNVWNADVMGDSLNVVGGFGARNTIGPGVFFFTSNAFLVVANNANPLLATQIGVFKGPTTTGTGDPWLFPATDTAGAASFNTDALTAPNVLIGGYGVGTYGDNTANGGTGWFGDGVNALELAVIPVPEPSTYALVGMALLGACGLRRRRRQA